MLINAIYLTLPLNIIGAVPQRLAANLLAAYAGPFNASNAGLPNALAGLTAGQSRSPNPLLNLLLDNR